MIDVFAIEDEIVEAIVHALTPALAGAPRPAVKRPTENVEAYELYLKGRHYWHQRSPGTLQTAESASSIRVIALDSEHALAHAGLADCHAIYPRRRLVDGPTRRNPAARASDRTRDGPRPRACRNPFRAGALHVLLRAPLARVDRTICGARIAINPRFAEARSYLGVCLACDGRTERAVAAGREACDARRRSLRSPTTCTRPR